MCSEITMIINDNLFDYVVDEFMYVERGRAIRKPLFPVPGRGEIFYALLAPSG